MIVYNILFLVCGDSVTQIVITTFSLIIVFKGGLSKFKLVARVSHRPQLYQSISTLIRWILLKIIIVAFTFHIIGFSSTEEDQIHMLPILYYQYHSCWARPSTGMMLTQYAGIFRL